jgi:hypothetical protein
MTEKKQRVPLQKIPLEVRKRLRQSVFEAWHKNPRKPSREFDLTQEERDYLARHLRWYRSLTRVEPPDGYGPGALVYKGKPDPAFNYLVQIKRRNASRAGWGYMQPRGLVRPMPVPVLPKEGEPASGAEPADLNP